jgi:predicted DNA-binding transcriptional regulator AlpA
MNRKPRLTGTMDTNPVPAVPTTPRLQIMGVHEVAVMLGVPDSSVYEWCRYRATNRGSVIPHRRLGKYLKFIRSEVEAWLLQMPYTVRLKKRAYRKQEKIA